MHGYFHEIAGPMTSEKASLRRLQESVTAGSLGRVQTHLLDLWEL